MAGHKRLKTQGGNHREESSPQLPLPGFSHAINQEASQDATPRNPMS
jgi:hypothetical protein